MTISEQLLADVRAWQAVDPDPETIAELDALVAAGDAGELADRFSGFLQFGTAGLRAAIAAGPMRMNRVVVRRAAWGLVQWLLATNPNARTVGLTIGYDARKNSKAFAWDTAGVAAALGVPSHIIDAELPTPVLAAATISLGAGFGVMVTASHNPPQDNGYKVYNADGSQICAPVDGEMAAHIALAPAAPEVDIDSSLITVHGDDLVESYLALVPHVDAAEVKVAYTAMHGVGGSTLVAAFERAGLPAPVVVAEQFVPDGTFPTVSFPNPEEPGAMDLLLALAAKEGADIALANDPDADRLGAAIPQPDGSWRRLGGDEIGWLLADHLLRTTADRGANRMLITTVVSSTLLGSMAEAHGVRYAEAFTGFKFIADQIRRHPDADFVFGYEQALGYLVNQRLRDKDGITAAVMFAELAADAARNGETLQGRLDGFSDRYGRHLIADRSVRMPPAEGKAAVEALRADPPSSVAGHAVTEVVWFEEAGLLRLQCGPNARVQVRPSGTEPKVKIYAEAVGIEPDDLLGAIETLIAP